MARRTKTRSAPPSGPTAAVPDGHVRVSKWSGMRSIWAFHKRQTACWHLGNLSRGRWVQHRDFANCGV